MADKMADLCHLVNQWFIAALGFAGLYKEMFCTGLGLSWILKKVAAKMVYLSRMLARSCSILAADAPWAAPGRRLPA